MGSITFKMGLAMKKIYFVYLYLLSFLLTSLHADLVWEPGKGWSASSGILEPILGKSINIENAEEGMRIGKEEYQAGNILASLRAYKKVHDCYPNSILAPEALYQMGQIYIERHQYAPAFNALQKIVIDYPSYPKFNEVIAIEYQIASQLQLGNRPYCLGIIPWFKDYSSAIEFFESIVTNAPSSIYAPRALLNIAELAKKHKKIEDVIDALDRLISSYKRSEQAPDAYIELADAYRDMVHGPLYDQGATLKAINYYQDFLLLFPKHERVEEAETKLVEARDLFARSKLEMGNFFYYHRNNLSAAAIYYNETISAAPNSIASGTACEQLKLTSKGILPAETFCDKLFGRYKPLSTPAYLEEAELENRKNEEFRLDINEFPLELVDQGYDELAPGADAPPAY